jgi:hypothetical protein
VAPGSKLTKRVFGTSSFVTFAVGAASATDYPGDVLGNWYAYRIPRRNVQTLTPRSASFRLTRVPSKSMLSVDVNIRSLVRLSLQQRDARLQPLVPLRPADVVGVKGAYLPLR